MSRREAVAEWRRQQALKAPTVVRCARCGFEATVPAADAHTAFAEHACRVATS